jgi:ABC-type nitrate/sulfonate/bicarbonate transport system substrate-binding protein
MERSLRLKKRLGLASIAIIALAMVLGSASCQKDYSGPVESITLGAQPLEAAIPIFIAQDQELFQRNGLNVSLKSYDTGLNALNGMIQGEVDVAATVSDYAMVGKVFDKPSAKIIGSLGKLNAVSIVARKDRGIENVSDLKGKRVGIIPRTNVEFFLGRTMELQGINVKDVTFIDVGTLQKSVDAVVSGSVDAIVNIPPYTDMAQSQLGNNAVVFPAQSSQFIYGLLISSDAWLKQQSNAAELFLKAMDQAEQYMVQHPQESKAIAKKKLNLTDDEITRVWERNQFLLSLDQSLITAMEDEARWMIANNLTTEKTVPDFLNYIYLDGLKTVKPGAVNIIH